MTTTERLFVALLGMMLLTSVMAAVVATTISVTPSNNDPPPTTPTLTPSPTLARTPVPTAQPVPVAYFRVTYYGPGFEGGPVACGSDVYGLFDADDPTTAASGTGGPGCGTHLVLCSGKLCQMVVIKDACGGCGPDHLDLSRAAWDALGQPEYVTAAVTQPVVLGAGQAVLGSGQTIFSPTPTPTPTVEPPSALYGGVIGQLPLPAGTSLVRTGCASDGTCYPFNFYWAPTHEAVLQPGEPYYKETHELCHAHQAWAIGRDLSPSEYDLQPWYSTNEGQQFMAEIGIPDPWPFSHSAINGLESFAWVCGFYYADSQQLHDLCLVCYNWARRNLP